MCSSIGDAMCRGNLSRAGAKLGEVGVSPLASGLSVYKQQHTLQRGKYIYKFIQSIHETLRSNALVLK